MKRFLAMMLAVLTLMMVSLAPVVSASASDASDDWAAEDDDGVFESIVKWNARGVMKVAEGTVWLGEKIADGAGYVKDGVVYCAEKVADGVSYAADKVADGVVYCVKKIFSWF